MKTRDLTIIALCLALSLIFGFSLLLTTAAGNGSMVHCEPDTPIYLQYGKAVAEGHPYCFQQGEPPSTGSTTHLYPFVLAICYKIFNSNQPYLVSVFILNAAFFIGIILITWMIARKLDKRIAIPALFLTTLSGHTLAATLHLTDMGFFSMLTLALFCSILYKRPNWTIALSFLCALTRPEGLFIAIALLIAALREWRLSQRNPLSTEETGRSNNIRSLLIAAGVGLLGFSLTLIINFILTGHVQFMSVYNKGYFNSLSFSGAISKSLYDAVDMLKGILLGIPLSNRQFFTFPILGGILTLTGILLLTRKNFHTRLAEWTWGLTTLASLAAISTSQWQGLSNDRYLAWLYPLLLIYALIGIEELRVRIKAPALRPILLTLLTGYQLLSLIIVFTQSYTTAILLKNERSFIHQASTFLKTGDSIGFSEGSMAIAAFDFPQYISYNIYGIISPDFFIPNNEGPQQIVDHLKNHSRLKFDYWMARTDYAERNTWAKPFLKEALITETDGGFYSTTTKSLFPTDWTALNGGESPITATNSLQEWIQVDKLDVGFYEDEISHSYSYETRLSSVRIPLITTTTNLGNIKAYSENGRIIVGSEFFTSKNIIPNQPLKIILRTNRHISPAISLFATSPITLDRYELNETIQLHLFIDDQEIPTNPITLLENGYTETILEVPRKYIKNDHIKIKLSGDHISYAYWIYQPSNKK